MTPSTRGHMAGADALLWTIDRDPVLRSTIVAVLVLDQAPDQEEVRRLLGGLTAVVPRLRCRGTRPLLGLGAPQWTTDVPFDVDQHLHRVAAPAPGTLDTVLELAQGMAGVAFDRELPLWEALVVEGLEHGQAAIVFKVHHSVVDGIGGLSALLRVAEVAPRDEVAPGEDGKPRSAVASALAAARGLVGHVVADPRAAAAEAAHDVATVGRLLAPAPTPRSPLMRRRGVIRRFGVLDLSLPDMRRSAVSLGATINDVFVAGVLGGLERYHELHGRPVPELRALIPVSIRRRGDVVGTNRFVPVRFLLPAAVADPATRVRHVHEALGAPVHDPALRVSDAVATVLSRFPPAVATAAFGSMLKGNDFVATNVPGPRSEVRVAGGRLLRIYAFSPPTGAGCNVSLVSVGRHASLGINIDVAAVPDGTLLVECLRAAFTELTRMGHPARAPHQNGERQ